MQERYLYEYAVIRFVPRVEREEFINVGLILFCKKAGFIRVMYHLEETKIRLFSEEADFAELKCNLQSFDKISRGTKDGGAIAQLDLTERFRWLTAVRSSSIQTSRPQRGFSNDLEETTKKLFAELVL